MPRFDAGAFRSRVGRRIFVFFVACSLVPVAGFAFYILSDVIFAVGLSGRLPVALAAWAPAGITILLGLTTLLHLEDG